MSVKTHIILSLNDIKLLNEKYIKRTKSSFYRKSTNVDKVIQVKLLRKVSQFLILHVF